MPFSKYSLLRVPSLEELPVAQYGTKRTGMDSLIAQLYESSLTKSPGFKTPESISLSAIRSAALLDGAVINNLQLEYIHINKQLQ